jgi:conjugative transfer pilus assembly protein TraH
MNTLANDINKANINSCETAAGLVGSVWPRTHAAQKSVCQDIGTQQGIFSDYAAARQGCGSGGDMDATLNNATGPYKNLALNKGNLAWKALQTNSLFSNDAQLAEFLMSLSGTLIINNTGSDDDSKNQYTVLPSLASDQSLLKALLYGGQAKIYVCDTTAQDGCINPTLQSVNISSDDALSNHVSKMLNDMVSKIYSDTALSPDEIGLLNATTLPVYKILNVQAAFSANSSVLNVQDYANVIASDILFQYLNENLSAVKASSVSMQYPSSLMEPYLKGIEDARNNIRQLQGSAYAQMNMAAQLINQTQTLEQMLAGSLSSRLNGSLTWANNLRGA